MKYKYKKFSMKGGDWKFTITQKAAQDLAQAMADMWSKATGDAVKHQSSINQPMADKIMKEANQAGHNFALLHNRMLCELRRQKDVRMRRIARN